MDGTAEKVQTGLRIPIKRYQELCAISERAGISLNALALYLIDVGLSTVDLGVKAADHALPHSLPHIDGQ